MESLYKIVENPSSLQNYRNIQEYYQEKGMENIADAFRNLIEIRYVNSHNIEQNQQD